MTWVSTRSSEPIAASQGLFGEDCDGDWLYWLLVVGAVGATACCGEGAVGAEAATGVATWGTHWGYAVEPWSLVTVGATAGETGLGVEAWICWLIATRIS